MGEYIFSSGRWEGHSVNDTIPDPVGKYLQRRYDTDTKIIYYSDGINWKRLDQVLGVHVDTGLDLPVLSQTPDDPESGHALLYPKEKDEQNEGLFIKKLNNGAIEEVEVGYMDDALVVNDLVDVTNVLPSNNQSLVYQTGSGTFENKKLKSRVWMTTTISTATNGARYLGWGAAAGSSTSENLVRTPIFSPFILKRVTITITGNAKDGSTIFGIRKNNADVSGTGHTVAAGQTTSFDSGELNVAFSSGDFIDVKCDLSASSNSNSITAMVVTSYEVEAYA